MQPNNRITYRFDRNGNKIEDGTIFNHTLNIHEATKKTQQPVIHLENQLPSLEPDGQELYGLDIESLEQLIRGSNQEDETSNQMRDENKQYTSAVDGVTDDSYNESFNWYIDDNDTDPFNQKEDEWASDFSSPYEKNAVKEPALKAIDRMDYKNNKDVKSLPELDEELYQADEYMTYKNSYIKGNRDSEIVDARVTNKSSFTWGNGLVTVLCAVATGMLLGYLLLVQVFGSMLWQPSPQSQAPLSTDSESTIPIVPSSNDEATAGAINTSEAHYSYQLLQAGVFSQENTRDEAIASLQSAGYAASYTKSSNDKYYVYTAVATSAINAEPFKNAVSGFELYRKELALQIPASMKFHGEAELLENYFNTSNALIAMYADLVAAQLEQSSLSKIGGSAQEAAQRKFELWEKNAEEALAGFSDTESESYVLKINEALENAQANLMKYQSTPSKKTIWSVEEEIVKTIIIQKEWFEQLS